MAVDPYCFPGTNVLRNIPGIRDAAELEIHESLTAAMAGVTLYKSIPDVTDLTYLKLIHRALFGQVYSWAGETRVNLGRMAKTRANGSVVLYGDCAFVDAELDRIFVLIRGEAYLRGLPLASFAMRAAYFYGELDAIHPFREGNSRTLRMFFFALVQNAGFSLDWTVYSRTEAAREVLYRARDRAVMRGDSTALAELFSSILSPL